MGLTKSKVLRDIMLCWHSNSTYHLAVSSRNFRTFSSYSESPFVCSRNLHTLCSYSKSLSYTLDIVSEPAWKDAALPTEQPLSIFQFLLLFISTKQLLSKKTYTAVSMFIINRNWRNHHKNYNLFSMWNTYLVPHIQKLPIIRL